SSTASWPATAAASTPSSRPRAAWSRSRPSPAVRSRWRRQPVAASPARSRRAPMAARGRNPPVSARTLPAWPPPRASRRGGAEAPALSPAQAGGGRTGWLSELLTRASHEAEAPTREAPRETPPSPEAARPERHTVDSLDSLAVDIARMIDHDAAAELWDRYK